MRWRWLFLCAALTSISSSALADEAKGEMVVYLTGGKTFRGSVVESVPGKHYVVARPDGMTLKLPWSAVRAILPTSAPPPPEEPDAEEKKPEQAASPEPRSAPRRPTLTGPTAFVEIQSPKRIQLQWSEDGSGKWETACMSPCNTALPAGGVYRVVDDGGHPQKPFQLGHDGKVTIQVTPRSTGQDALGIISLVGGTISLYGGAIAADEASKNDSAPTVAILFGLSGMLVGTILLAVNGSSTQIDQGSTKLARSAPKKPLRLDPNGGGLTVRF